MNWVMGYITDLSEEEYAAVYAKLSVSRKAHIDRIKPTDARKRSLLATHLLSGLLQAGVLLETDSDGKPFLSGSDLHVSISHSAEAVVCAVSTDHVGIDIEKIRPVERKLVEYVCTERERAYVLKQDEGCDERFFEVWTAKEASYKHDGGAIPLRAIDTMTLQKQCFVTEGYCITVI